jgi:hypothetical protein
MGVGDHAGEQSQLHDVKASRDFYTAGRDLTVNHIHKGRSVTIFLVCAFVVAGTFAAIFYPRGTLSHASAHLPVSASASASRSSTPSRPAVHSPTASAAASHSPHPSAAPTALALPETLDFSHSTIATGLHSNGTDDVFGIDRQGQVIHSVMGSTTGNWGPWTPFGPEGTADAITVAADSNKLLHVMVVMDDDAIQERSEEALNQWGSWQLFAPAGTAKVLALGRDLVGNLEVWAVTPGGQLIRRTQVVPGGDSWTNWTTVVLAGTAQSVAVTQQIAGYLQVIAVMADGSVEWAGEQQTGWSPWSQLGPPGTAVAATIGQYANGALDVFALNSDGTISDKYQYDRPGYPWSDWVPNFQPCCTAASINVDAQYQQRLAVLALGTDHTIRIVFEETVNGPWTGGWKVFGPPGGFGVGSPSP